MTMRAKLYNTDKHTEQQNKDSVQNESEIKYQIRKKTKGQKIDRYGRNKPRVSSLHPGVDATLSQHRTTIQF